jgi:hypothetical protein
VTDEQNETQEQPEETVFEQPMDEQEQAPEAESEFAEVEEQFPADVDPEEEEPAPTLDPMKPIDEQHPAIQAEIAARDRALQAKVNEKARKAEIKEAKAARAKK